MTLPCDVVIELRCCLVLALYHHHVNNENNSNRIHYLLQKQPTHDNVIQANEPSTSEKQTRKNNFKLIFKKNEFVVIILLEWSYLQHE